MCSVRVYRKRVHTGGGGGAAAGYRLGYRRTILLHAGLLDLAVKLI